MLRSPARTVPRLRLTSLACLTTSKPFTCAVPLVGSSKVQSMRIVVDFPAPFGPSKLKIHAIDGSKQGFWLFLGEETSFALWGRASLRASITCACAGGEFFDQLSGFDCELSHLKLLFKS